MPHPPRACLNVFAGDGDGHLGQDQCRSVPEDGVCEGGIDVHIGGGVGVKRGCLGDDLQPLDSSPRACSDGVVRGDTFDGVGWIPRVRLPSG